MRLLKWMIAIAMATALTACGNDQSAEETAETAQDKAESAYEETKEEAGEAWEETKEETAEAMDEVQESDAWESTKDRAKEAWVATKEFSQEAWADVRESFRGDMTPAEKQAFDDCVARLQKVEGLTEEQAERGCWRMMEEDSTEDYYAEEADSDFWADTKAGASEAWESTKEGSKEAWEATKEGSKKAWAATKEYSQEAWQEVRESFTGDMTAEEKKSFDACVARLQKEEGLTKDQAERGCWRMMEEAEESEESGG